MFEVSTLVADVVREFFSIMAVHQDLTSVCPYACMYSVTFTVRHFFSNSQMSKLTGNPNSGELHLSLISKTFQLHTWMIGVNLSIIAPPYVTVWEVGGRGRAFWYSARLTLLIGFAKALIDGDFRHFRLTYLVEDSSHAVVSTRSSTSVDSENFLVSFMGVNWLQEQLLGVHNICHPI